MQVSYFFRFILATALSLTMGLSTARAHGVTLVVHHAMPADSAFHTQFLLPWTQKLEKESAGLLRFRFTPGSDSAKLSDWVNDREADIVFTLTRFAPTRYPAMEAFERTPIRHSAQGASRAAWEYARLNELAEKEFDGLRLLAVSLTPGTGNGADVGLLLINGRSYKALTEPLRKVVNDNAGEDISALIAVALTGGQPGAMTQSTDTLDGWIADATQRGLDAKALAQSARALMAEYDIRKP